MWSDSRRSGKEDNKTDEDAHNKNMEELLGLLFNETDAVQGRYVRISTSHEVDGVKVKWNGAKPAGDVKALKIVGVDAPGKESCVRLKGNFVFVNPHNPSSNSLYRPSLLKLALSPAAKLETRKAHLALPNRPEASPQIHHCNVNRCFLIASCRG